jgi:hypothetical protein
MNIANIYKPFLSLASLVTTIVSSSLIASPAEALVLGGYAVVGGFTASDYSLSPKNPQPTDIEILNKSDLSAYDNKVGSHIIEGDDVFVLTEKQNITLEENLTIYGNYFYTDPNYKAIDALTVDLSKGRKVSSDLVWVDPVGRGAIGGDGKRLAWEGTLKFRTPILGILTRNIIVPTQRRTNYTNSIFGLNDVTYSIGQLDNVLDEVTFEGNTLNFRLTAGDGADHFRVITAANVPEPLTIIGTGLALGFGFMFKRKSMKTEKVSENLSLTLH